jgi:hypothetical protein
MRRQPSMTRPANEKGAEAVRRRALRGPSSVERGILSDDLGGLAQCRVGDRREQDARGDQGARNLVIVDSLDAGLCKFRRRYGRLARAWRGQSARTP